jgi:hypothetical protein
MEIISRIKLKKRGPETDDLTGRIAWLAKFCRLEQIEVEVLAVLARSYAPEPDGWPVAELARQVGVSEHTVRELVSVGSPLSEWGLVRVSPKLDALVVLNERIERFLFAPPPPRP